MVLICLIFSVLSTIEEYSSFANETLFWMVRYNLITNLIKNCSCIKVCTINEVFYCIHNLVYHGVGLVQGAHLE